MTPPARSRPAGFTLALFELAAGGGGGTGGDKVQSITFEWLAAGIGSGGTGAAAAAIAL